MLNAIVSSIDDQKSLVKGHYSVAFNRDRTYQPIINQADTYKFFDFVSGINDL